MGHMEGRLDILSSGSSCDHVSGGGTLGQCPTVRPPGQNGLLKRIVLPLLAFGFSAEFPSLILQLLSIWGARDISSVNFSFG